MTLHDKLKEILEKHEYEALLHDKFAIIPDPAPSTIAAIIQAVAERLPGERDEPKIIHDWDFGHVAGWNAYREEVRKVLAGE